MIVVLKSDFEKYVKARKIRHYNIFDATLKSLRLSKPLEKYITENYDELSLFYPDIIQKYNS